MKGARQTTLCDHTALCGVGIHSGLPVTLTLHPAAADTGLRFVRTGIEGRISVLRRTVQLRRCPYRGLDGFERWVGWGVLVANLTVMARIYHKRHARNRVRKK